MLTGDSLALPVSRPVDTELTAASVVQQTLVLVLALPACAVQLEAWLAGTLETAGDIETPPSFTGTGQALQHTEFSSLARSLSSLTSSTSSHWPPLKTKPG